MSVRGLAVYLYSSPASVGDSGVGGQGWRGGGVKQVTSIFLLMVLLPLLPPVQAGQTICSPVSIGDAKQKVCVCGGWWWGI